jgi:hypothetical protein
VSDPFSTKSKNEVADLIQNICCFHQWRPPPLQKSVATVLLWRLAEEATVMNKLDTYSYMHFGDGLILPEPSVGVFAVMLRACTPLASSAASTWFTSLWDITRGSSSTSSGQ